MLKYSPSYEAACRSFRWHIPEFYNFALDLCDTQTHEGVDAWRSAVVIEQPDGTVEHLSFYDLHDQSRRLVGALSSRGLVAGERVLVSLRPSAALVLTLIALGKLGAVTVPLPVAQATPENLSILLQAVSCRAAILEDDLRPLLPQAGQALLFTLGPDSLNQAIAEDDGQFAPEPSHADDPAFLFFDPEKGGTGVVQAHRAVLGNLPGVEFALDFFPRPEDRFWCGVDWLSFEGLMWGVLPALHHGVPLIAGPDEIPVLDLLARHGVRTVLISTPRLLDITARANRTLMLRSLACFPVVPEEAFLPKITRHFGVTPNGLWGTPLLGAVAAENRRLMDWVPNAVGRMAPGLTVDVVDDDNHRLPADEIGRFALSTATPSAGLGFWRDGMILSTETDDGLVVGPEQGLRDLDGYIYPEDIGTAVFDTPTLETLLSCLPDIAEVALLDDPRTVRAFVVLAEGNRPTPERNDQLRSLIERYHPRHHAPEHIITVRAFPHDEQGRLDREALISYIMRLDAPDPDERLSAGPLSRQD